MTKKTSTKAYLTVIDVNADPIGVALKCYTHSAEDRFLSVGWLHLPEKRLEELLAAVRRERELAEQPMLPPWDQGSDNVRWLPPQP